MQKGTPHPAEGMSVVVFVVTCMSFSFFSLTPGALAGDRDVARGKALYEKHCAVCHGPEGKGDGYSLLDPPPADLTSEAVQKKSYEELWQEVHDGIPDTAMGTWKFTLSNGEITSVLSYMRTLAR